MADLKVLGVAHNPQQFPGFLPSPALSLQFRDPSLLSDQACLPFNDKFSGVSEHSLDHRGRMGAHGDNIRAD